METRGAQNIQTVSKKNTDKSQKIRKLPLAHQPLRPNEILVNRKKPKSVFLKRAHKLFFDLNFETITLQGVGAAVQRTIDIALQLQETYSGISFEVKTFTIPIRDVILPKQLEEAKKDQDSKESSDQEEIEEASNGEQSEDDCWGGFSEEKVRFNSGVSIKVQINLG